MELGLEGKVAIITGGSAGLGFASACELAKEGCHVVICARNLERRLDAKKRIEQISNIEVLAIQSDVSSLSDTKKIVKEVVGNFSTVHILLINDGLSLTKSFLDLERKDWKELMNLNLYAGVELCKEVCDDLCMEANVKKCAVMTMFVEKVDYKWNKICCDE